MQGGLTFLHQEGVEVHGPSPRARGIDGSLEKACGFGVSAVVILLVFRRRRARPRTHRLCPKPSTEAFRPGGWLRLPSRPERPLILVRRKACDGVRSGIGCATQAGGYVPCSQARGSPCSRLPHHHLNSGPTCARCRSGNHAHASLSVREMKPKQDQVPVQACAFVFKRRGPG